MQCFPKLIFYECAIAGARQPPAHAGYIKFYGFGTPNFGPIARGAAGSYHKSALSVGIKNCKKRMVQEVERRSGGPEGRLGEKEPECVCV